MKNSTIYNKDGTEYQHHLKWLAVLGLFETAYMLEDNTKGVNIRWLLNVMLEGRNT